MHRHRLIRRVVVVRGEMRFVIEVQPRFDYGRAEHEVEMHPHGVLFRSPRLTLALEGAIAKAMGSRAAARARRRRHPRDVRARRRPVADVRARARAGDHICRPVPRARDGGVVRRDGRLLAALARAVALQRPLARDGPPLGADAEAADLRADRRARRRADHARCPSSSAASATGTTATPGSATPRSRSTACCGSASPRRPRRSWTG